MRWRLGRHVVHVAGIPSSNDPRRAQDHSTKVIWMKIVIMRQYRRRIRGVLSIIDSSWIIPRKRDCKNRCGQSIFFFEKRATHGREVPRNGICVYNCWPNIFGKPYVKWVPFTGQKVISPCWFDKCYMKPGTLRAFPACLAMGKKSLLIQHNLLLYTARLEIFKHRFLYQVYMTM
jgi:hypothetical protein